MCQFNDDCAAGEEAYFEEDVLETGGASIGAFGCDECGYWNAL